MTFRNPPALRPNAGQRVRSGGAAATSALLQLASSVTVTLSKLRSQLEAWQGQPSSAANHAGEHRSLVDDARPCATVVSDTRLIEGYEYWRRKAAGRRMPRRADIDPIEIPKLLPHVRLIDVIGPGRYRYRLVGTEIQTFHGANPTGRYVHEVLGGPVGTRIVAIYDECMCDRRAIYFEYEFLALDRGGLHRRSKVLFTPLSEDGKVVNQVLVFQVMLAANRFAKDPVDPYTGPYNEIIHAPIMSDGALIIRQGHDRTDWTRR
jgi:hypothetical protein